MLLASLIMPSVTYAHTSVDRPEHLEVEQDVGSVQFAIEPEQPIVGSTTEIIASGTWSNSCVPALHDVIVEPEFGGLSVTIEAVPSNHGECNALATDWSIAASITFEEPAETVAQFIFIDDELSIAYWERPSTSFFIHQGIVLQPSAPTTNENILLSISGWTPNCLPRYLSHTIEDQTITVHLGIPDDIGVCAQSPSQWTEEVSIGSLEAGVYRAEAYVRLFKYESSSLLHALDFTVGGDKPENAVDGSAEEIEAMPQHQIFMPIIKMNKKMRYSQPCTSDALLSKLC